MNTLPGTVGRPGSWGDGTQVERVRRWPYQLWALYIGLSPVYILPSGMPQPSDFLLTVGVALFFLTGGFRIEREILVPIVAIWAFVAYGFLVSGFVTISTLDTEPLIRQVFFIYCAVMFTYTLLIAHRAPKQFMLSTFWGLAISVFLVAVTLVVGLNVGRIRQSGLFNNPNQLAHFSILTFTSLCVLSIALKKYRTTAVILAIVAVALGTFGVSFGGLSGAIVGLAIYALYFFRHRSTRRILLLLAVLTAGIVPIVYFGRAMSSGPSRVEGVTTELLGAWDQRLGRLDRKIEELGTQRGYNRIVNYPQYLIFGAARGAPWRFGSTLEIHSSLGSILFSYGIVGSILFLIFLGWFAWKVGFGLFMLTTPVWIYSIGHYGLNQTSFWALFVILLTVRRLLDEERSATGSIRAVHRPGIPQRPQPWLGASHTPGLPG